MPPADRLDAALLARAERALRRRDPVLRPVIRAAGPCALRPRGDPYRFLVRSILQQQVAGAAAAAVERRLRAAFGGRIPAAERLAAAPDATLRGAGLSRQKAAGVRAVAAAFRDGELRARRLARLSDAEVIEAVTRIRGVGVWTAHMLLLTSLGRPDVLPVGDYGVRKAARDLYALPSLPGRAELEALARERRWRPYASVVTWYLWRSTELGIPGSASA